MTYFTDRRQIRKTRAADIRLKNNRLGMKLFQISWMMAFLAIAMVNWQLRFSYAQWPPAGVAAFNPILPSLATAALIASVWLVRQSLKALRGGAGAAFLNRWRLAIGLGLAFMAIIIYEFAAVSDAALATQYGQTFRLMTGFHFVHALVIAALMVKVYRNAEQGMYSGDESDSWAVEGAAKLWYFVTAAWILFYAVLYWLR